MHKHIDSFKKKLEREMKSGLISLLVLSIIRKAENPVYGYRIICETREATNGSLILKEGSVYPILHYLQDKKFVVSFLDESPNGAPRKCYTITKLGEQAFEEGINIWEEMRDLTDSIFTGEEV